MTLNKKIKNSDINNKLDLILKQQKKILMTNEKILSNEFGILEEETKIEQLNNIELEKEDKNQKTEEDALNELINLETKFKQNITSSIDKITKRDLFKGFVGAFVGIMGHFAFDEAYHIANDLTFLRSSILYVIAFLIIIIMLYYTGFRTVKSHLILKFLPLRALILYVVSIIAIIFVNLLFGNINFPLNFIELYNLIGASIILAVLGAGTADLIGGVGEKE